VVTHLHHLEKYISEKEMFISAILAKMLYPLISIWLVNICVCVRYATACNFLQKHLHESEFSPYLSVAHDDNLVGVTDGRQPMRHHLSQHEQQQDAKSAYFTGDWCRKMIAHYI
jgi:hypothetical protein